MINKCFSCKNNRKIYSDQMCEPCYLKKYNLLSKGEIRHKNYKGKETRLIKEDKEMVFISAAAASRFLDKPARLVPKAIRENFLIDGWKAEYVEGNKIYENSITKS